jgi:formamidopyrimidine-DNA glycosylase
MPELPDVERFRRYFNRTALHKKIERVEVENDKVLAGVSKKELTRRLKGRSFESSDRHGKHMFAQLDDGGWVAFHFGMTGFFRYYKNEEHRPDHPRVILGFANGYELAFDSQRMIGRIALIDDPGDYMKKHELGIDGLSPELDGERFKKLIGGSSGMIKSTLMNQSIIAGLGNVYSDEVLFQARIHPKTDVEDLSDRDLDRLYRSMKDVLEKIIHSSIDPDEMDPSLMTAHRGRDDECPGCGGKMEKIKVSGRNGYYCPKCQKKD